MSWWCEKCQVLNYGKDKCMECGHPHIENIRSYPVPKGNSARIINYHQYEDEKTITLNKNTVIMVAVVIIAISMAYLAISEYKENRANEKAMELLFGTSDMDEIMEKNKEILKNLGKM